VRAAAVEVWGLFVTDGLLALFAVAALIAVYLFVSRTTGEKTNAGLVLVAGVVVALAISLWAAARAAVASRSSAEPSRDEPAPVD
jgi:hypothetical protein